MGENNAFGQASRPDHGQRSPARSAAWLPCGLGGFVAGVALQLQEAVLFSPAVYGLMLGLALALALAMTAGGRATALAPRRWPKARLATLLLVGVVGVGAGAGFGMTGLRALAFGQTALNPALEGQDIVVTGQVMAMPQFGDDGLRFRLAVASATLNGHAVTLPPQIYLGWYNGFANRSAQSPGPSASPPDGDLETPEASAQAVLALQRQPQAVQAGERWRLTVRLKAPHGNSNPHGFDYELWLWEQGLQATGYVRAGSKDAPPQRLSTGWSHPMERARQAVRAAIFERVANRQLAGVLAALVVGDQNAIERADWDVFRATGVAHLMSISGLHITMFAWLAARCLSGLWRRSARITPAFCLRCPAGRVGAVGGLLLAALYALFSGWGVPAQRTIWMLAAVVLLRQSGKQWPWPLVWLLAMAVVVALSPWALMQAGFWLSFVAVGILFASGPTGGKHDNDTVDASTANTTKLIAKNAINTVTTGTFDALNPVLRRFGLSTQGFRAVVRPVRQLVGGLGRAVLGSAREQWVVTLALTPLALLLFNQVSLVGLLANAVAIPWVTLVVTPLAMLGVLWPPLWDAAALAVGGLSQALQWLAGFPLATVSVAAAPLWCAVAGVLGGALMAMRLPLHWRLIGVPLMLPVLLWQPLRPAEGQFELLGADIGQGNAVLVRTANHSLVYDTGPRFSRESDAGHRVLTPLLRALGERIDLLVLSHRDLDHIGGAGAVLASQPQARLLSSLEDGHALLESLANAQPVRPFERCFAGQKWRWDGVDFEILHPQAPDYAAPARSNAMSCVLRISSGGGASTALLVGDIEAAQEQRLASDAAARPLLKADFLLMPHHGSKTSSTADFLDAVQPQFALAQAGYRNRFGHPVPSVLQRYRERGITVIKSPVCGAATWQSQQSAAITCQRAVGLRYWHHRAEAAPASTQP